MPHDDIEDHPAHSVLPPDPALRVKAIETVLHRKGLIEPAALDQIIEYYEHRVGPQNGARVVARAWSDANFKKRLLLDATEAAASMGYGGRQGEHLVAVENNERTHNLVVCTLCSCYPWTLLGIPPSWYKSDEYRSRAVLEPRKVLAEFGVELLSTQKVRVWDSTAEIRYLVVPLRPPETSGLDEPELAEWVTRDSMIGTGLPNDPATRR